MVAPRQAPSPWQGSCVVLAFGSGAGGVGEEPLAVRCPFELALEPAPEAHVLLALRRWDGKAALLIQGKVTV